MYTLFAHRIQMHVCQLAECSKHLDILQWTQRKHHFQKEGVKALNEKLRKAKEKWSLLYLVWRQVPEMVK